jgi:hypothetical protein
MRITTASPVRSARRVVLAPVIAAIAILAMSLPAQAVWEMLYVSYTGPCTSVHTAGDGEAKPRLYSQTSIEWSGTLDHRVRTNAAGNDFDSVRPGYKGDCGGGAAWARSFQIVMKQIVHVKVPGAQCAGGDLGVLIPGGFTLDKGRSSCGDVFAFKTTTCRARSGVNVEECKGYIGSLEWVAAGTISKFSRQIHAKFWARDTKSPSLILETSDCWKSKDGSQGCY